MSESNEVEQHWFNSFCGEFLGMPGGTLSNPTDSGFANDMSTNSSDLCDTPSRQSDTNSYFTEEEMDLRSINNGSATRGELEIIPMSCFNTPDVSFVMTSREDLTPVSSAGTSTGQHEDDNSWLLYRVKSPPRASYSLMQEQQMDQVMLHNYSAGCGCCSNYCYPPDSPYLASNNESSKYFNDTSNHNNDHNTEKRNSKRDTTEAKRNGIQQTHMEQNNNNNYVFKGSMNSGALDLTMPKMEVNYETPTQQTTTNHDTVEILHQNGYYEVDAELPEDLPDLSFAQLRISLPENGVRNRTLRWVYFVRRRMLKLSTIRRMFGLSGGEQVSIKLVYGGRGITNPLKSNIPPFATHASHDRKYRCLYCKKEFKNTKILARHYTQHTSYRRFFCVVCWRGFYDSHDLRRHLQQHLEVRVFYCELCEAIFSQNVSKESHFTRIHPNIYNL